MQNVDTEEGECILDIAHGLKKREEAWNTKKGHIGYPRFISDDCAAWFFHWLAFRFRNCPKGTACEICAYVVRNIDFATALLIEAIYNMHHDFTAGSNIVSVNMGYLTQRKVNEILDTTPLLLGLTEAEEEDIARKRVKDSLAKDFSGLTAVDGLTKLCWCLYTRHG